MFELNALRQFVLAMDSYIHTHLQYTYFPFHIKITLRVTYYTSSKKIFNKKLPYYYGKNNFSILNLN